MERKIKGKLIPPECHHIFEYLQGEEREEAIRVNGFRDQKIGLYQCKLCGGYQWSM